MSTRYVIIGNSAAGIGAAEGIRRPDREGSVTIISDEPHFTYSRPLISYLLLGKTDEKRMKYRPAGFYEDNGITLMAGKRAKSVDPVRKSVILNDGQAIPYDKLLVATGSSPFVPKMDGLNTVENKFTFMSLNDALALRNALTPQSRVLIIGGGLIGLKCAEGIAKSVASITIVDLAQSVLSSILDADGSAMVQARLEREGAVFRLGKSVAGFEGNEATLNDGEKIAFDALVLAVGVRPNTSLLEGIANIERGIIINSRMETSRSDIYAAGDCTQSVDASSGQSKVMALLPNAYAQGETAGVNMAGGYKVFDRAIPMNAIGFFGLHMITAGNYTGEVYEEADGQNYKKLFYGGGKLNGYILIGNVEKAGIYTALIRERTPLDTIDFDLICKRPGLMAFTKEARHAKLGAV